MHTCDLVTLQPCDLITMESLKAYLKDIRNIPLLTPKEEFELAKKVKRGDKEARKQMIRANLRIVINIAKRYAYFGLPLMDLIEEGNMGLMRAVDKFNPLRGFRFSTYSAWWIRQAIGRAISDQSRLIRLPVYMGETIYKWKKANESLSQKLGRLPNDDELAKAMKVSVKKLKKVNSWVSKTSSLEAPIGEEGEDKVRDMVEDTNAESPQEKISKVMDKERISGLLDHMTERERRILDLRFGLQDEEQHTLAQIAKKLKVSRERIRQIEKIALKKLRKLVSVQEKED